MALEKAIITNTVTNQRIEVLFNPEEYTVNRDVNYAQQGVPGASGPIIQFIHGNMQTLEMELLVDSYEAHSSAGRIRNGAGQDVRSLTRQITDLMEINPATHAPPILLFTWSSLSFKCVLARASQRFNMFLPDGTPARARLNVTFNEYRNVDLEPREVRRETADHTKLYVVGQGENLSTIAAHSYGNPALWRPIALRNNIDNPHSLSIGMHLVVPPLPFRDPDTGEVYQ